MHAKAGHVSLWAPVVAAMIAIFVASSIPHLQRLPGDISDHTGHFATYAVLAALVLRALAGAAWTGINAFTPASAWALATAYGITDEVHQIFVPGRTAALDDLAADALGAASAVVLIALVGFVRRSRAV